MTATKAAGTGKLKSYRHTALVSPVQLSGEINSERRFIFGLYWLPLAALGSAKTSPKKILKH